MVTEECLVSFRKVILPVLGIPLVFLMGILPVVVTQIQTQTQTLILTTLLAILVVILHQDDLVAVRLETLPIMILLTMILPIMTLNPTMTLATMMNPTY